MISHLHGRKAPFELADGIVYFHDWRYVFHGGYKWEDAEGNAVPMWGIEPHPPAYYKHLDIPLGIQLMAQKASKTEPVVTPEQATELFLFGGTLIHDEGVYRLWCDGWPLASIGTDRMGHDNHVRYAESDDGSTWRFPSLGLLEQKGSRENSLVYGRPLTERFGYHGGSVFKDSAAPPGERYKIFYLGWLGEEQFAQYQRERPDAVDPAALRRGGAWALCGGVSPDGLRWTTLPNPLLVQCSDTHNVCEYDPVRGKYVGYVRSWYFNRRTIGRTETDDFRRFPLPEELFWPDATVKPYELWYANAKTRMPGTRDYHVMFPLRWSLLEDRFDFHLATSPDGVVWGFVPGGPVCTPGEPGTWDGGVVAPGLGLVELPGGRLAMLYCGTPVPHKHPRRPPLGALAWAWWPRGRLVALRAAETGSFALWPLKTNGRTVHLNFKTPMAGFIKVEVVGQDGDAVPGRSFEECDPLRGNQLDQPVTWRGGEADTSLPEGQPVQLRFQLRSADLFSVRFV